MITVRRSDTGSYVLVHEPSQTVIVGDDLEATYARMQEHLRDHPAEPTPAPAPPTATSPGRSWLVGLGLLAVLPFLWLAVLHYTLGSLVDDLRAELGADATESRAEVQSLRSELEALRQTVVRLESSSAGTPRVAPPSASPVRMAAPERPRDLSRAVPASDEPTTPAEAKDPDDATDEDADAAEDGDALESDGD